MNSNWTLINYRELKKQIKNAVSELGTVLELKGVVTDTSKLPLTGNKKGDVYIVSEDNTEYVWTSDNTSGLVTNYEELGPVISGSFLPPVTETDAGKVATVNDSGVWGAQEPSGGQFIITVTKQGGLYSMDKTKDEVIAAYERGDVLLGRYGNIDYVFIGRYRLASNNILYFQSAEMAYFEQLLTIDLVSGEVDLNSANSLNGYVTVDNLAPSDKKNTFLYVNNYGQLDFVDLSPFIVTLTPTALDYSGTMDKTVAEMTEAYNAGRQIVWRVIMASNRYVDVNVTAVMTDTTYDYPSFNAYVIEIDTGVLVYAHIPTTNDGTVQTYCTELYTLTPAT